MLSDEALVAMDRSELVDIAQPVYDQELRSRRLTSDAGEGEADHGDPDGVGAPKPRWLDDAACAAEFASAPGRDSAPDAANARDVLETAGIPCYLETQKVNPEAGPRAQYEFRILVPGKFNLEAVSLLDKEIFNPEIEAEYRTYFAQLSDEELRAVKPSVLLAGLSDRIERLTRAYQDELDRRKPE
jgi:hypothetical protein